MKIALLTVYTDNLKPLADIVIPNMQKYCDKHGYELHAFNITGTNIYFGYKKIENIISLLRRDREVDVALCLDLDTLITNHNIKVESFLNTANDFYITKDVNGINAGSFIVKNSPWTKYFLRLVYDCQSECECEQDAMTSLISEGENNDKIKILPHSSINSYLYDEYGEGYGVIGDRKINKPTHEEGNWDKGDFLLHLPGMTMNRRIEIFNKLKTEIIL